MEFIIITGFSGAGKTAAMHALEDIGFYCVDNLPCSLLRTFYNLVENSTNKVMKKVAVVIDARGGDTLSSLENEIKHFKVEGKKFKLLFLYSEFSTLVMRFKETRRRHPLVDFVDDSTIKSALELEKRYLDPLKKHADYIIDTTNIDQKVLKTRISTLFLDNISESIVLNFMSFGFKHGTPLDCDTIFDVRCLPNPYYEPELKQKTGLDKDVFDYVFSTEESKTFVNKLIDYLDFAVPLYKNEGKAELVVGIGCTGGHHRSVAISSLLQKHFTDKGYKTVISHRDIHNN